MRCFVTGADGFIGSHLAEALVKEGHDVTGLALYNSFDSYGWMDECEGMAKVHGDIRDAEQMQALIRGHDIVFHLAALISVPYSYEAPRSYIETNVVGTLNVLEAARLFRAKVVHTSTSEVYGTALYTPQDEKHPLQAQSPYAASKIAADKLVESYHLTYGLKTVTLRPFNTFGPRQSKRAVIPSIISQALDPECEVIEIGDVTTERDFTYVSDTVAAFLAVMDKEGLFTCGSGETVTINHVLRQILGNVAPGEQLWQSVDVRKRPINSEVRKLCAAPNVPGWEPQVSLVEGLQRTIDWWRQR